MAGRVFGQFTRCGAHRRRFLPCMRLLHCHRRRFLLCASRISGLLPVTGHRVARRAAVGLPGAGDMDVQRVVTDRIAAVLAAGEPVLRDRWVRAAMHGMPRNGRTGVPYRGVNVLLLPALDKVRLPWPASFASAEAHCAAVLQELVHSSGHASRLDRDFGRYAGDAAWVFEELVAELGSIFLMGHCGLAGVGMQGHAASSCLDARLRMLRGDPREHGAIAAGQRRVAAGPRGQR
jgi:antirestriction protein ArdC